MTTASARLVIEGGLAAVWAFAVPAMSLAVAVVLAAVVASPNASAIPALLPILVIAYWQTRGPALPVALAFAAGLYLDCVTLGPMGFWALTDLVVWHLAAQFADWARSSFLGHGVMLVSVLLVATGLQGAAAIAFAANPPTLLEAASAMAVGLLAYPVLARCLAVLTLERLALPVIAFRPADRP